MGAGASAASEKVLLESDLASREQQGTRLGAEFEVYLVRPALKHCKPRELYLLRVGYEALVLTKCNDDAKTPLTYFKYQDIMCWGSTSALFQFKVFGPVMGREDPVAIVFNTTQGKTLETVTLTSVHALMADMDKAAVTKTAFNALKELLDPELREKKLREQASAAAKADPVSSWVVPKKASDGVSGGGSGGGATTGGGTDGGTDGGDGGGGGVATAIVVAHSIGAGAAGAGDDSLWDVAEGIVVDELPESEVFVSKVKQFGASRAYTIHQAVDLMRLAKRLGCLDSFDMMDFAMFLWGNILNRDSFQLVLNVFEDTLDRDNLIARIKATNTDRASASLLLSNCPDSGGGMVESQAAAASKKKPPQRKDSKMRAVPN